MFKHLMHLVGVTFWLRVTVFITGMFLVSQTAVTFGQSYQLRQIAFSPDGTKIALTSADATCHSTDRNSRPIEIYDATTMVLIYQLLGMRCGSTDLDWSPDSQRLAALNSAESIVYIWNVTDQMLMKQIPANVQGSSWIRWSPTNNLIAVGTFGDTTVLVDANSGVIPVGINGSVVSWSPSGARIASGSNARSQLFIYEVSGAGSNIAVHVAFAINQTSGRSLFVDWSQDGSRIASANSEGVAYVWNAVTGSEVAAIPVTGLTTLRLSPDGSHLATANENGQVQVWNIQTLQQVGLTLTFFEPVFSLSWKPNGTELVTFSPVSNNISTLNVPVTSTSTPTPTETPQPTATLGGTPTPTRRSGR